MELTEHTFEELSTLKHRIYTTSLPNFLDHHVLIVAFDGKYGYGCKGSDDATYIWAIVVAAKAAWKSSFFVLDYRSMTYEWGDDLLVATGQEEQAHSLTAEERNSRLAFGSMPEYSATLTSDRNREAIHSLMDSECGHGSDASWLFDDLDSALTVFEDVWRQCQIEHVAFLEQADTL